MHAGLHRRNLSLYTDPRTSRVDQWGGENKNQLALAGNPVAVLVSDTGTESYLGWILCSRTELRHGSVIKSTGHSSRGPSFKS